MTRNDKEDLVAIDDLPFVVNHDHPVAIPVEGDSYIRPLLQNGSHQSLWAGGSAAVIDIDAIGASSDGVHCSPQLPEHAGRHMVGGPLGRSEERRVGKACRT